MGRGRQRGYTGLAVAVILVIIVGGIWLKDVQQRRMRAAFEKEMLDPGRDPLGGMPMLVQKELERTLGIRWSPAGRQNAFLVADVRRGSPAEKAGFRPGDQIRSCQGEPVRGPMPLLQILSRRVRDGNVEFEVVRDNESHVLRVHEMPKVELPEGMGGSGHEPPRFLELPGFEMQVEFISGREPREVRIAAVVPRGPAAKSGLRAGDVITSCEGLPVERPLELISAPQNKPVGGTVTLEIVRGGKPLTVQVRGAGRGKPAPPKTEAAPTPPAPGAGPRGYAARYEEGGSCL